MPMGSRKAAVFADIHSNYYAFKACIEDAKQWGAECFIFLGDYVSDLADPGRTLDLIRNISEEFPCYFVRGNRDTYMLDCRDGKAMFYKGSKSGSLLFTYQNLSQKDFDFLREMPIYQKIDLWGIPVEIAHATADSDRQFYEMNDNYIDHVFEQMQTQYLLSGHSHVQYIQSCGGKTIINPGSVGVHIHHGCLTQYARLTVENEAIHVQLMQIPYDLKKTIYRQFESGLVEYANFWAISVLYNLIRGENWTIALLERVNELSMGDKNGVFDEALWKQGCIELGIPLTLEGILAAAKNVINLRE